MRTTSRYAGLQVIPIGDDNEREEPSPRGLLDGAAVESAGGTYEYVTTQGDRIDYLAYLHLGDSRLWWVIADMNPDVDHLLLQGGELLHMPRLEILQ